MRSGQADQQRPTAGTDLGKVWSFPYAPFHQVSVNGLILAPFPALRQL
jgi:hypothetical protein